VATKTHLELLTQLQISGNEYPYEKGKGFNLKRKVLFGIVQEKSGINGNSKIELWMCCFLEQG